MGIEQIWYEKFNKRSRQLDIADRQIRVMMNRLREIERVTTDTAASVLANRALEEVDRYERIKQK